LRYFTFRKTAFAVKKPWQVLRFTVGKGYWLFGLRPKPVGPIVMYDDVNVSLIPKTAQAVAGYVGGRWRTFPTLKKMFPTKPVLSIAVAADEDADCLDVENGDATNAQAVGWAKRQLANGRKSVTIYSSVANWPALENVLVRAGVPRSRVKRFTAHYTGKPHLCTSRCWTGFTGTADATQFTDHANGVSLDASLCSPTFFVP